jgi:hypothetical protein
VRLIFPPRPDRLKLVDLLVDRQLGREPPIREVLELLGREVHRFSRTFEDTYSKARRSFLRGEASADLEGLWSAVREAASVADLREAGQRSRVGYQLFLETNELFEAEPILMATDVPTRMRGAVRFTPSDIPFREYRFVISAPGEAGASLIIRLLLQGALDDPLPDFTRSALRIAVQQGVLLFRQNEEGIWELAISRPEEERVRALVRDDLLDPFRSIFPARDRPQIRRSRYDAWSEVAAFDIALLARLDTERSSPLERIRCLQPTRTGVQMRLAEGISLEAGYLGLPGFLPVVRVSNAEEIALYQLSPSDTVPEIQLRGTLRARSEDPDSFEFPDGIGELDGRFNLVATREGHVLASRQVVFRARVVTHDFAQPTAPERWIIEAARSDVSSVTDATNELLDGVPEIREDRSSEPNRRPTHRARGTAAEGLAPSLASVTPDTDPRLDRFLEVAAAIAATRKGIAEGEFLTLLARCLGFDDSDLVWGVARAWLETGYFDALTRRGWRGRVYFSREPRLVFLQRGGVAMVTLLGLAPYGLRRRVAAVLRSRGGIPRTPSSCSADVPPPPTWAVDSVERALSISQELGLGPLLRVRSPAEVARPIREVCAEPLDPPMNYEKRGVWDWSRGRFSPPPPPLVSRVQLSWLTRPDRPECFVVERDDGFSWWTYSRNWGLLVAYLWAAKPAFRQAGASAFTRASASGPHLPLPLARAVALRAGVAPGPYIAGGSAGGYAYAFADSEERTAIEDVLWGRRDTARAEIARRCRWLLALAESTRARAAGPRIALPPDLRRRLLAMSEIPESADLAACRVPPYLLPHVRRVAELANG